MKGTHCLSVCSLAFVLGTAVVGCSRPPAEPGPPAPSRAAVPEVPRGGASALGDQAGPAQGRDRAGEHEPVAEAAPGHEGAHDHGHGEAEATDLDRSPAELLAARCEHEIPTYTCDECRYEVGVVKAAEELFTQGLLQRSPVALRQVAQALDLTGEVRFDERSVTHLSTQAAGIVRRVHVALGERVRAGQALLEIESVALGEAQAAWLEAAALERLAERSQQRVSQLRRAGIAAEREDVEANQALEAARIRSEAAFGKLLSLGMARGDAQTLAASSARGRLVLRAPADGTLLSLHAVPGELARGDESLAVIGDSRTVWVWADLYERDLARVAAAAAGDAPLDASVSVRAYPDEEFAGRLDFLSPAMDEGSRTVKLRIAVPNPAGRLLAGMFARVRLLLPAADVALVPVVPAEALLEDAGRAFVFVRQEGDYYLRRPVSPGQRVGDTVEVLAGLVGGEAVVSKGAFLLKSDVLRAKMGAGCAD